VAISAVVAPVSPLPPPSGAELPDSDAAVATGAIEATLPGLVVPALSVDESHAASSNAETRPATEARTMRCGIT
jgi:hypothetical protein